MGKTNMMKMWISNWNFKNIVWTATTRIEVGKFDGLTSNQVTNQSNTQCSEYFPGGVGGQLIIF